MLHTTRYTSTYDDQYIHLQSVKSSDDMYTISFVDHSKETDKKTQHVSIESLKGLAQYESMGFFFKGA